MAKLLGLVVAIVIGGLLAVTVNYATVATQKPDAKQENLQVPADVTQAGGRAPRAHDLEDRRGPGGRSVRAAPLPRRRRAVLRTAAPG